MFNWKFSRTRQDQTTAQRGTKGVTYRSHQHLQSPTELVHGFRVRHQKCIYHQVVVRWIARHWANTGKHIQITFLGQLHMDAIVSGKRSCFTKAVWKVLNCDQFAVMLWSSFFNLNLKATSHDYMEKNIFFFDRHQQSSSEDWSRNILTWITVKDDDVQIVLC